MLNATDTQVTTIPCAFTVFNIKKAECHVHSARSLKYEKIERENIFSPFECLAS